MECYGRVERVDGSIITIKKDGDGEIISVDKKVAADAAEGGLEFEIDLRVVFTTSLDGSRVLSLRKCDENEGATASEEAAKGADQAKKSA